MCLWDTEMCQKPPFNADESSKKRVNIHVTEDENTQCGSLTQVAPIGLSFTKFSASWIKLLSLDDMRVAALVLCTGHIFKEKATFRLVHNPIALNKLGAFSFILKNNILSPSSALIKVSGWSLNTDLTHDIMYCVIRMCFTLTSKPCLG